MTTIITATERLVKAPAESITKTWNFTKWLASAETLLSGTITQTNNTTGATELTIGSAVVNSSEITIDGVTIAIGKALQALVSEGQAGVHYDLEATVISSNPQTFVLIGDLLVSDA